MAELVRYFGWKKYQLDWVNQKNVCGRVSLSKWIEPFVSKDTPLQDGTTNASKSMGRKDCAGIRFRLWRFISEVTMKRIIPVYIFQQVNVLLVSLYLFKFLCIDELTILQVLYGASLISFLWMYGQRKQAHKINMNSRIKWIGIGLASLLIISLCFSLIHAQGTTNQANLIILQYQVPWFSFLLFLINASMVEEFLYREILWNLVRKLDIRIALTSVLFALVHHPGTILAWCLYVSLGMFLGMVRYKSDLWGSMGLHLVWNLLVYSLLLF